MHKLINPDYLNQQLLSLDSPDSDIPVWSHTLVSPNPRRAAVLIPLLAPTPENPDCRLLLTRRAEHLKVHPGEISFPGGAMEPEDNGLLATALRETAEETGIQAHYVQPLGMLGELDTISGYRLRAYVGWVREGYQLQAEQAEVAELILTDFEPVMSADSFNWQQRSTSAGTFNLPEIQLNGHRVWGVTGVILWRLIERLMKPLASDQSNQ